MKITRNNNSFEIEGNFILAKNENNIEAFRKLCKELGSSATFSKEIKTKKDIDFTEDEIILADVKPLKLIKELEKNNAVKAYLIEQDKFDELEKKTTKPIILSINHKEEVKKNADAYLINFIENGELIEIDQRIVEEISKLNKPVFVSSKYEKPEDIYAILKKSETDMFVFNSQIFKQPVIFEQTTNYFEKGYYNKITRKRREKTVALFERICKDIEFTDKDEINKFTNKFLEEN